MHTATPVQRKAPWPRADAQPTRPLSGTVCMDCDRFVHRHLQQFLDGLRAPDRSELLVAAATKEDPLRA